MSISDQDARLIARAVTDRRVRQTYGIGWIEALALGVQIVRAILALYDLLQRRQAMAQRYPDADPEQIDLLMVTDRDADLALLFALRGAEEAER